MSSEKNNDRVAAFDVRVRGETEKEGYNVCTGWDGGNVGGRIAIACWTQKPLDSLPRYEEVADKVLLHCQCVCDTAAQWVR